MREVTPMHYDLVSEYKEQQYKDLLTSSNVVGGKVHINKVTLPGGIVEDSYDFWGYILQKNGIKYLLSSVDNNGKEIELRDLLPIYPEGLSNIAFQGVAYKEIGNPIPARIDAKNIRGFRGMVDDLNSSQSTNPLHRTVFTINTVMQRLTRAYGRTCTPMAFGKDSTVEILDEIYGGCGSVSDPTVAKLEFMTALKLLVMNEASNISKSNWRELQQFLLVATDFKDKINKRSRATRGVEEVISIKDLSIALYYNDIDTYSNYSTFIDYIGDGNLLDRLPAFRFYGGYDEDFSLINKVNPQSYVKQHFNFYKDIARTLAYYEDYFKTSTIDFNDERLDKMPKRWKRNMLVYIKGYKEYANGDEDLFNSLVDESFKAINDYKEMTLFPENYELLMAKMKIPVKVWEKSCSLQKARGYLITIRDDTTKHDTLRDNAESKIAFLDKVIEAKMFSEKNLLCQYYNNSKSDVTL